MRVWAPSRTMTRTHRACLASESISKVNRVDRRTDLWEITVRPDSSKDVVIALVGNRDCGGTGAICTEAKKRLASNATLVISGPKR